MSDGATERADEGTSVRRRRIVRAAALVLISACLPQAILVAAPPEGSDVPPAIEPSSGPVEPSPEAVRNAERVLEGIRNFVRRAFAPGLPDEDPDSDSRDEFRPSIVPLVDRALRRQFDAARAAGAAGRWGEAAELFEALLRHPEASGFLKQGTDGTRWIGYRAAVLQAVLELPPEGLAAFETRFGPDARRALADAVAVDDAAALHALVERALPTQAGRAALFRLCVRASERGEDALALDYARRLRSLPGARDEFGPGLALRALVSAARLGRTDEAVDWLLHARSAARGPIVLRGRPVALPETDDPVRLALWIRTRVGGGPVSPRSGPPTVLPGMPGERSTAASFRPVGTPRWYRATTDDPGEQRRIAEVAARATSAVRDPESAAPDAHAPSDDGRGHRMRIPRSAAADSDDPSAIDVPLPQFHPRVVGGLVLMRTVDGIAAHDLRTGRFRWSYPSRTDRGQSGLSARLWSDVAAGASTVDGETLYLVAPDDRAGPDEEERAARDLRGAVQAPLVGWGFRPGAAGRVRMLRQARAFGLPVPPMGEPTDDDVPAARRMLVALDCRLPREGNRLWHVGGRDGGDEPALAGAEFLGPPRPHAGRLFAVARIGASLRLVVLEPTTGRLDWSVEIGLAPQGHSAAEQRRIGAVPSAEGDLVVCPTGAGLLAGVDLATRAVRWAVETDSSAARAIEPEIVGDETEGAVDPTTRALGSVEAGAILVDGRILVLSSDPGTVRCLDARDGATVWDLEVEDCRYVAAIDAKRAVLVGNRQMQALRLADGRPAWKQPVSFPVGVHPAGRGWQSGTTYLLPLANGTIGTVDLAAGRLREPIVLRPDLVPGNLYLADGSLVSQGPTRLAVFDAADRLAEETARRLQADPRDASALVDRARLEWDAPRPLERVLPTLRSAVRIAPDPRTRDLLVKALLEAIRTNHGDRAALERELDALAGP